MRWVFFAAEALFLVGAILARPADAAAIKPGRWEFTAQLQPAARTPAAHSPRIPQQAAGGVKATYTGCIEPDKAVPAEFGPQCTLDDTQRRGGLFSWSMTCANSRGKVRSDGVARYHGDTMAGTMISHLPAASGAVTDMTQRIVGRYLGPCRQPGSLAMGRRYTTAQPPGQGEASRSPTGLAPAAAAPSRDDAATGSKADAENADAAAQSGRGEIVHRHAAHPRRYAYRRHGYRRHYRYSRHYARRYGGGAYYSYSGFGPAPYSGSGP